MSKPIFESSFWSERLRTARQPHHAVFVCQKPHWDAIAARHREIIARHVRPADAILDAACGWGRMIDLLPPGEYEYVGVDLSPDFIDLARREHPQSRYEFVVGDLRDLSGVLEARRGRKFDWAIAISVKHMVIREAGMEAWQTIENELKRVSKKILYLEYDTNDEGTIEIC